MAITVFSEFGSQFVSQIGDFAGTVSSSMIGVLGPILSSALILYFLWKGWTILFSNGQGTIPQLIIQVTKIALVAYFALNAGHYSQYVIDAVYEMENVLIGVVSSAGGEGNTASAWTAIDSMWEMFVKALSQFNEILGNTSWITSAILCIMLVIIMLVMGILSVFFTFAAVATLLINETLLIIVLGFGPLFICMLMFPATRGFFDGWLKSCLTYVFTLVIAAAVISLFESSFNFCITKMLMCITGNSVNIGEVMLPLMNFCVLSLTAATLVKLVPSVTAGLVGGVSLQAVGIGQMLGGISRTGATMIGAGLAGGAGAYARLTGSESALRIAQYGNKVYEANGGNAIPGAFGIKALSGMAGSAAGLANAEYQDKVQPMIDAASHLRLTRALNAANAQAVDTPSNATNATSSNHAASAGSVAQEFDYQYVSSAKNAASAATVSAANNSADIASAQQASARSTVDIDNAQRAAARSSADIAREQASASASAHVAGSSSSQSANSDASNADFAKSHLSDEKDKS